MKSEREFQPEEQCTATQAHGAADKMRSGTNLFIIKQRGRNLFWTCSDEHGCGWHDGNPKQSFSPSELTRELRLLIDMNWFTHCEILELSAPI